MSRGLHRNELGAEATGSKLESIKLITHLCRNRGELVLVAPGEKILNFLHTVYSLLGTLTGFRCFRSDIRSVEGGSSSSVFNGLCGWISCGHE